MRAIVEWCEILYDVWWVFDICEVKLERFSQVGYALNMIYWSNVNYAEKWICDLVYD